MRKILFSRAGTKYLLDDEFRDNRAAGAVNGTPATPGPGVRVVTDTGNTLSIGSGVASGSGTGVGDPRLSGTVTHIAGRVALADVLQTNAATVFDVGFDSDLAGICAGGLRLSATAIRFISGGIEGAAIGVVAPGTQYRVAIVLRAIGGGYYGFIKGGAFTSWTLVWVNSANLGTIACTVIDWRTSTATSSWLRVPADLWLPTPLAYDTFTRGNGALGSSESTGPDGQAVTSRVWTGATWAVSTNAAVNTPVLGADEVANGAFTTDANWTKGAGWTIDVGDSNVATATAADNTSLSNQAPGTVATVGVWYQITCDISGYVGGTLAFTPDGSTGAGPVGSGDGSYLRTRRAAAAGRAAVVAGAGASAFTGNIDNFTRKPLTLSELFASITPSHADVLCDANVTFTAGTQAGLALRLDSAAVPANFLIAYLLSTSAGTVQCILDKCVAGTYTNLIAAAVTYVAGATLRVITSGSSVTVFYNQIAVGTTQTVADAGILNNTLHGLFSTSALNSLDNFLIFPRGSSNEYSALDKWSGTNP